MAGHSKWANIKHRKGAQDAKKGKLFTKLIREITVAARASSDVNNPRLRAAIDKALGQNMTRSTIDRAIKRGVGGEESALLEQICYEGYGPYGVAMMVDCLTDNRNRTVSEVRHAFNKMGGNLGIEGSVAYLFNKKGQIYFSHNVDENTLIEAALEVGAEDVDKAEDFIVTTSFECFDAVLLGLEKQGFSPEHFEVSQVASTHVALNEAQAQKFLKLVDMLEELDDVQQVHANADLPAGMDLV